MTRAWQGDTPGGSPLGVPSGADTSPGMRLLSSDGPTVRSVPSGGGRHAVPVSPVDDPRVRAEIIAARRNARLARRAEARRDAATGTGPVPEPVLVPELVAAPARRPSPTPRPRPAAPAPPEGEEPTGPLRHVVAPPPPPGPPARPWAGWWAPAHAPLRPQLYQAPTDRLPGPPPPQGPPPALPHDPSGVAAPLGEASPVRYAGERPNDGWQGRVHAATGGRVSPGPSRAQRARQAMITAVRRPLHDSHRVAVMSVKGGVGKTTVAACLGLVLAENRGDRVIALDANPDAGTLADRLTGRTPRTVRDLLDNIADATTITEVDRFTTLAGRLQVLSSAQDPAAGAAFSRDEYAQVCAVLARFANIVVTDSGTGLVHSAMEGTLALADSLVVVGAPTLDGAGRASMTLDWLAAHGQAALAADALVVLSCDRWSRHVDRAQVRAHFEARCRGVVEIPFDPYLAIGGRIQLPALQQATIDAFLLLAARVADGFEDSASPARP